MSAEASQGDEQVGSAELVATLCLATDLGMGFPFEHGLRSTLIATRLADRLGVDSATASETYYACLLSHAGCTADAHVTPEVFGDSLTTHLHPVMYGSGREVLLGLLRALPEPDRSAPVRAFQAARGLPRMAREQRPHLTASCEVAGMLAIEVGVAPSVAGLLAYITERWDGRGPLRRAKGEAIPLQMRIVHVAVDAAFQRLLGGVERAARLVRERSGHAFDPEVAACLADRAEEILTLGEHESAWDETLAREPGPPLMLSGGRLDRALAAMGNFADLISPYLAGHSAGVAELATAAAARCGSMCRTTTLRRAALVHDLGRVAVGAQGVAEARCAERRRMGAGAPPPVPHGARRLPLAVPVSARADRGRAPRAHRRLRISSWLIGCGADAARPYARRGRRLPRNDRAPSAPRGDSPEQAAEELAREAGSGRLDPDAVTAVVETAGQPAPRLERPAGLTEREAEVVGMLARGLQTKQIALALGISVKTADRHIQNAYRKIGVSTRAAATLFAMEHGLVAWGELPMVRPAVRP